jgi:hypothetical protein
VHAGAAVGQLELVVDTVEAIEAGVDTGEIRAAVAVAAASVAQEVDSYLLHGGFDPETVGLFVRSIITMAVRGSQSNRFEELN